MAHLQPGPALISSLQRAAQAGQLFLLVLLDIKDSLQDRGPWHLLVGCTGRPGCVLPGDPGPCCRHGGRRHIDELEVYLCDGAAVRLSLSPRPLPRVRQGSRMHRRIGHHHRATCVLFNKYTVSVAAKPGGQRHPTSLPVVVGKKGVTARESGTYYLMVLTWLSGTGAPLLMESWPSWDSSAVDNRLQGAQIRCWQLTSTRTYSRAVFS